MPRRVKRTPATLRSTSGAGFEFEDLIAAWLVVKALSGEQAPGVGGVCSQLQAQVSTLGWRIDDLLLTSEVNGAPRRLAISAKGNQQVSASGLPSDFVERAWKQWLDPQGPFNLAADGLALVTLGTLQTFDAAWREVKNACSGHDVALTMSRIRSNPRQSRVFDSVQKPGGTSIATDEETIEIVRRLHVLPTDLQFSYSETENQAIAQCRRLLVSGEAAEGEALWKSLISVATDVRLRKGTITIQDLWSILRVQFALRHHPNFERDWETLSYITSDRKARIETELPSGYAVPRTAEIALLRTAVAENSVTVVFGESGCGKSALVKSVLDIEFPSWNQVWFGPEELKTALSASRRASLPLRHELAQVLNATVKPMNVLIIDSAERIEAAEVVAIRQLLQAILPEAEQPAQDEWRAVVVAQTQGWVEGEETVLGAKKVKLVELEQISSADVKVALLPSPMLGWLTGHDDTIAALRNLRTLAWVMKAGAALGSSPSGLASHTAIADRLWRYWSQDRADVQALMMRLAKRDASFERSFALTDLDPADSVIFTQRPAELPLRLNERTNRVEFEHDLAADWARFQFLKQILTDTSQWAALAENPLWTNALRMLGQFLLRQTAEIGTAWATAFHAAAAANNELAGDILLDALCLDSDAERFLTERVDLLFANGARVFTRLLLRFHHIATVPAGGPLALSSAVGLYIEAQYRSVVFARWPGVLRFLIAQRERLAGLVSPALAKVIETWLTKTPRELGNGTLMPFRREMAEIALAMARTMQVEKGHDVIYLTRELSLYTAPLAGAADLPDEVGDWALELAGRREVDAAVTRRIAEVRRQQAKDHAERLKTDQEYKARHEERRQMPRTIGSSRERLPPWPLGASGKVDVDYRTACFKNGIQPLMHARPNIAAEVLLALIIEDQPEREYGSHRYEVDLALEYARDAYPTAFWKSPFFSFLQFAPDAALGALIALVNFCTERWVAEVMRGREKTPPGVTLVLGDGSEKTFPGWWQVFGWPQSNSLRNGNLFSALDALERWLTFKLEAGDDISAVLERLLREGNSAALVSVLVNMAKYRPSLLTGTLAPLLTFPNVFYWDSVRVGQIHNNFIGWSWLQAGQAMFDFARDWTLAPHRGKKLLDVVVELLKAEDEVARRLEALIPTWSLPEDPKEKLEFELIYAALDRANYQRAADPETGAVALRFVCPADLSLKVQSWQNDKALQRMPDRCEQRLQDRQALTEKEAMYLYDHLKTHEGDTNADERGKSRFRLAVAACLITLGGDWVASTPEAQSYALAVLRKAISGIPSNGRDIRDRRIGSSGEELKFAAYAVMHLWLDEGTRSEGTRTEWETAVLRLLTSGDASAATTVVGIAYAHRDQLGPAWWRLLQAGVLWSGLILQAPHHGDDGATECAWSMWLARLRRFPLRGRAANPDDLDFQRVAAGCERLRFDREMRLYVSGDRTWRTKPERRPGDTLDAQFLEILFGWLIDGAGTGDWSLDTRLALRIWDYDAARAKEHAKKDKHGEYDLPTQNLGYGVLLKLAALSIAAPDGEQQAVWEPILAHGPAAHYALRHFTQGLYLQLRKGDDLAGFERVWRAVAEYGLAADWSKPGLWFYGERLICDLLGFGNEDALAGLTQGAALRMRDVYERWAPTHLARDEDCVVRFSYFLTTSFGAPLRLDGLRWIAAVLKAKTPSDHWFRDGTGNALIELAAAAMSSDPQALSKDASTRQAVVEIAAALAAKNIPAALALQERIKLLR